MAQLKRLEAQVDLKCDADKIFEVWVCKPHLVPKICPNKSTKVELAEGEWDKVGSVKAWTSVINENGEDTTVSIKTRVEELDVENKKVRYSYHDGFIMNNYYKSFRSEMKVIPTAEGCTVKWIYEYEKMNEDAPEPYSCVNCARELAKELDAHLCSV